MTLAPSWYALQQQRHRRRMEPRRAHASAVTAFAAALRYERHWPTLAATAQAVLDCPDVLPGEANAARAVLGHVGTAW